MFVFLLVFSHCKLFLHVASPWSCALTLLRQTRGETVTLSFIFTSVLDLLYACQTRITVRPCDLYSHYGYDYEDMDAMLKLPMMMMLCVLPTKNQRRSLLLIVLTIFVL